jgi:RHH-type transcriptional regulator, rel operon repressor / antitoxin RelB
MASAASARAPVTIRIEEAKRLALDELAARLGRDRSSLINEALDAYLAAQSWQLEHIIEGLRQADAGEFATPEEVDAAFARWRTRPA